MWSYKVSKIYTHNINFDIREGEWSTSPFFTLTRGKTSQYPLNRRSSKPQNRFARLGEKVKSVLGSGIKFKFPPSPSPYCSLLLYRLSYHSCWRSRVGSPKRRHWCFKIATNRRKDKREINSKRLDGSPIPITLHISSIPYTFSPSSL